jgi:transcriptional regulator with XRE-family HTH domain
MISVRVRLSWVVVGMAVAPVASMGPVAGSSSAIGGTPAIPCEVIAGGQGRWYRPAVPRSAASTSVGPLLRSWRQRRHLTQLELANLAGVTTRHLSFTETGRARPSREMVLHLAEVLDVPLRERNNLLVAAGFAPTFRRGDLDDPSFASVRRALDRILAGHEPYPAIVVDRRWNLVAANAASAVLVEGVDDELLVPPVNVLRASLHPRGLGPRVRNLDAWSDHVLGQLRRQALITGDDELAALGDELAALVRDQGVEEGRGTGEAPSDIAIPLLLDSARGPLALVTTVTTFGTALDITLAELVLEAFLPGDDRTSELLHEYARGRGGCAQTSPIAG